MTKFVIDTVGAVKIFFYRTNEGHRPHLHFQHKNGLEVKVWLDAIQLKQSSGSKPFDRLALHLTGQYKAQSLASWETIYGKKK